MQTTTTAIILPESFDPANPQDVGAARSPGHSIRDRSSKQPALPYKKPDRPFVSRCFEVKLPCATKMVYIAIAHRCGVWTDGDEGTTGQLGRERIAADAGLCLTRTKKELATLISKELLAIKRTGRTNSYIVRTAAAALARSNATSTTKAPGEPWKAAGISRRTWYRDRARKCPKTTHGGARRDKSARVSSGTDGLTGGPSDGLTGGPSIVGVSVGSTTRTKRNARASCSTCTRTWPASYGAECYHCANQPQPPQRESSAPRPNWNPDGYTGTIIRNCPQCHVLERGYADRCQSCDWTRAAWEADELQQEIDEQQHRGRRGEADNRKEPNR